jgi:hypothetical protein
VANGLVTHVEHQLCEGVRLHRPGVSKRVEEAVSVHEEGGGEEGIP